MLAFGVYSIPGTIGFVNRTVATEGTAVGVESKPMGGDGFTILAAVTFMAKVADP